MKVQERINKKTIPSPRVHRGDTLTDGLGIVVASAIATLGLVAGGLWLYQTRESPPEKSLPPTQTQVRNSTSGVNYSEEQTDSSTQVALGGKAQIKILSAYRIEGKPDEVTVEIRISRVAENNVEPSDIIDPGATVARNPNTSETYPAVNPFTQASNPISISEIRPEQSVNAYVALQVPAGVKKIDIFIPHTVPFRNRAIANSNPTATSVNFRSQTPPKAEIVPVPIPNNSVSLPLPPVPLNSPTPKPGKFIRPAYGNKAQVELLSVRRIGNPKTGKQDIVNVQMRIRRLTNEAGLIDKINVSLITARDPKTSQVYKSFDAKQSTGDVLLGDIMPGASADAYVWLRVPESVNTLNLYIPKTQAFEKVPISK